MPLLELSYRQTKLLAKITKSNLSLEKLKLIEKKDLKKQKLVKSKHKVEWLKQKKD